MIIKRGDAQPIVNLIATSEELKKEDAQKLLEEASKVTDSKKEQKLENNGAK